MAGKALTGEVLPRAPRRARRGAQPADEVALAAARADGAPPIYAGVVADTGVDPDGEDRRWTAAHAGWADELVGWAP